MDYAPMSKVLSTYTPMEELALPLAQLVIHRRGPQLGLHRRHPLLGNFFSHSYTQHIIKLLTFCLFYIQPWSWERLQVGRPDFGRSAAYPALPVPHALHYDDVDVVNGDLVEALKDGLPVEPVVEPEAEPALPLGCRWRVPLTWVHNPSDVLFLYRDQLNAQTLDQLMIYVKVYGSIVISFIFT